MFFTDETPIIVDLPKSQEFANVYFIHDVHYGSELFNAKKWKVLKERIQADENAVVCWIGDLMENAIPNSKSDMFTQTKSPAEQKEWVTEQFCHLANKTKDIKTVHSSDYTDGIDFFASGHDHEAKDRPRAKLVFDKHNKVIYKRNVECLNCGSFCDFGGYGARAGYRPQSDKMYMLRIYSGQKQMETIGFYV